MDEKGQRNRFRRRDYSQEVVNTNRDEPSKAPLYYSTVPPSPVVDKNATPLDQPTKINVSTPNQASNNTSQQPIQPTPTAINSVTFAPTVNDLSPKRSKKGLFIGVTAIAVLILLSIGGWFYFSQSSSAKSPLPLSAIQPINFSAYYPNKLPPGYTYLKGSAKTQSGLLYYKLVNGKKVITVTQQEAPSNPVKLSALPKFTALQIDKGQAAIGVSLGSPSGILVTDTTITNIVSKGGASKDDIINVIKSLEAVESQSSN